MRANELRHQITIQSRGTADDANGQQIPAWTDFAHPRAKVEDLSGYEMMSAGGLHASDTVRITIRYKRNLTEKMRILYDGRVLDITSVSDIDGRRRELEIMCKAGVNQG